MDLERSTGPFAGVVMDEGDEPVAGATVWVSATEGSLIAGEARIAPVTTGADGRFTFTLPGACRSIRVGARAAGLAARRPDVLVRAGVDAVVAMTASSAVRVRVVGGADAAGVPGAKVLLFGGSNPEWRAWWDQADPSLAIDAGTTDTAGRVSLSAPEGQAGIVAVAQDGARGRLDTFAVLSDGADVVVALRPAGRISGVVVSSAGEPVGQAVVTSAGAFGFSFATKSAQDGTFTVEGVPTAADGGPAEQVLLTAAAPGSPTRRVWVDPPPAGAAREIRIALLPWETLSGRVVDMEGTAVAGASVRAAETLEWHSVPLPTEPDDPRTHATTAGDGSFQLDAFPPERGYVLAWKDGPEGRAVATASVVLPLPQPLVVRLGPPSPSLEAGRSVAVRVLDSAGSPVAKALLEAEIQVEENALFGMLDRRTTDDEGRARLENLRSDRVLLVVHLTSGLTVGVPLVLSEGEDAAERVIRLSRGVVTGRVVDLDGKPAPTRLRLEFVLRTSAGAETVFGGGLRQETAPDGSFRFEGVGDGEYQVVPDSPSQSWAGAAPRVRAGSDLTLVLANAADESRLHLEAEWIDARDGLAVRDVVGVATMKGSSPGPIVATLLPVAGTPGLWRSQSTVSPGTYDVSVRVPGYREARAVGVVVPAGSLPARLRQRLDPAGLIEGSVLGADGKPLPGRIEVSALEHAVDARPDGSFVLAVASEGEVDVVVSGEHVRAQTARVTVPATGAAHLDVVVARAGALRLRLADGQVPVKALRLELGSLDAPASAPLKIPMDLEWISAHSPSYVLAGLEAGRYRLTGTWDGVALAAVETVVREGETTTVDVHAPPR